MLQRRLIVMLIVLMTLNACRQSEAPQIDDLLDDPIINPLVYNISLELQWASPNPGERWAQVGRELVADNRATVIAIRVDVKDETDQDFAAMLALLTAETVTIETTETGIVYGRSNNVVSDYIIYRDFPNFVVTLSLLDVISDPVDPLYINDWQRIALEGSLIVLE